MLVGRHWNCRAGLLSAPADLVELNRIAKVLDTVDGDRASSFLWEVTTSHSPSYDFDLTDPGQVLLHQGTP